MPVTCYTYKDANLQNLLDGVSLDVDVKRTIFTRLQHAFPDSRDACAVLFHDDNSQQRTTPVPDLLILSERGIGLLNLCHESGSIFRSEDVWYADGKLVPGNIHIGARNPHDHVQLCAEHLRHYLTSPSRDSAPWLPGRYLTWQDLKFDTAVCFTHPQAHFKHIENGEQARSWERFQAFGLQDLLHWVDRLSFEQDISERDNVQSYRLPKDAIDRIVHELFASSPLEHLSASQRPPQYSYGYLLLKHHDDTVARFILDHEKMTVGREPSCDVILPKQYRMVSRVHARLVCTESAVIINDMSRNGIFIEGDRIRQSARLSSGQHILLGGDSPIDGVCQLEFSANHAQL